LDQGRAGQLAGALTHRIAVREESAAQRTVLEALDKAGIASRVVLCGSAALHGVYLHGRRTVSLDLIMPPPMATGLSGMLRSRGFVIFESTSPDTYAVAANSAVVPDLKVVISARPVRNLTFPIEQRAFSDASGRKTPVLTLALSYLVSRKLSTMVLRENPVDYLDLWMVSKEFPDIADELRELHAGYLGPRSSHDPVRLFSAEQALRRLDRIEARWIDDLKALVYPSPSFAHVRQDLAIWMPKLQAADCSK
jgi:hypothetical protein